MTQQALKIGDRVRLKIDVGGNPIERFEQIILDGTQGSIGVIVSINEYRAFREQKAQREYPNRWREFVQEREDLFQGIDAATKRRLLLVKFETVMLPSTQLNPGDFVNCQTGDIKQIHVDCLEKLETV